MDALSTNLRRELAAAAAALDEAKSGDGQTDADTGKRVPGELLDELIWASLAHATRGASPISLSTAWYDWLSHMALSPGRRTRLKAQAWNKAADAWLQVWQDTALAVWDARDGGTTPASERIARTLCQVHDDWTDWIEEAVKRPTGVSKAHAERVAFTLRQLLESTHPRNFFWTNPDALRVTREQGGANLIQGLSNFFEDARIGAFSGESAMAKTASEVGEHLAVTPGKVVYRNRLIELIQYEPTTKQVHKQPVLITPAWIMKYYVLDLSPGNSLVSYLLEQGFTVFMISWRNPDQDDRNLTFDDYRTLGVLSALEAVGEIVPDEHVHGVGYCLGGTLLSVAAAGLARDGDDPFASLTLLAAQTDFQDAGELSLFIDEAQLAALEAEMGTTGYLDGGQMAAAFTLLRSRDLVWRRMQEAYFLGQRGEMIDLMVWNNDTTRMPYRMHSEYLRRFFLNNDFVQGRLEIDGRPVAISDIRAPIFALGTTKDHVAPWQSVFKIHLFADTEVTFALTNGGHNAGVVSPPDHPRRRHHIHTKPDSHHYVDPEGWVDMATEVEGSWWPSWVDWLTDKSEGRVKARTPRRADTPTNTLPASEALEAAPGRSVLDDAPD